MNFGEIVNPGGDPGALREAARAWRAMDQVLHEIDQQVSRGEESFVAATWSGPDRDAYFGLRRQDTAGGAEGSPLLAMAAAVEGAADEIQRVNDQIHIIEVEMLGTLVVGGALTLLSFGLSDVAAAAEEAAAAAEAESLVAGLLRFLGELAMRFAFAVERFQPFAVRFAAQYRFNMALNALTGTALRWAAGGDPRQGWSATGFQELQLASLVGGGLNVPFDLPWARSLLINQRWWVPAHTNMGRAAAAGAAYRVLDGLTLRKESVLESIRGGGAYTLFVIALSGVIGGGWSRLATRLGEPEPQGLMAWSYRGRYLWEPTPAKQGLVGSVLVGLTGAALPAVSPFQLPPGTRWPAAPGSGAAAQLGPAGPPAPAPAAPPPPARGGGRHVVRPGESLWAIAGSVYGDPTLWPAIAQANHLPDPDFIEVGQRLVVPRLSLPEFGPPPGR